jgi:hypothetical protein
MMSRSYKKTPVHTDKWLGRRFTKRQASKAVRRYKDTIANGKAYRKIYCSWNICDFWIYETLKEVLHQWEKSDRPYYRNKSRKEIINQWAKYHYRK